MTSYTLRWISVAIILSGVLLLTLMNVGQWADGALRTAHFLIPIAYFSMLLGVIGLSIGWFMKQR